MAFVEKEGTIVFEPTQRDLERLAKGEITQADLDLIVESMTTFAQEIQKSQPKESERLRDKQAFFMEKIR